MQSIVDARTPACTASRRNTAASARATCSCAYTPTRSSPSHTPHTETTGATGGTTGAVAAAGRREGFRALGAGGGATVGRPGKLERQLLPRNPLGGRHPAARSVGAATTAPTAPTPPAGAPAGWAGSSARYTVARDTPNPASSSPIDSPSARRTRTCRTRAAVSFGGRPVFGPRARAAARAAAARSCINARSYSASASKIPASIRPVAVE